MAGFLWPGDSGWPQPDADDAVEPVDPSAEIDIDAVCLHAAGPRAFDELTDLERTVVAAHYGLGRPARSMKELHDELHLTRHQVRHQLESALWKLRAQLGP